MRRAVFNIPYSLIIGGVEFGPDLINSITISKSVSGVGLGSIVTQQISATVYADYSFGGNTSVTVVGFDGLPTFYIDGENRTEDTVSITAYDKCRKLSQPFDYADLKDGDNVDDNGDPIYTDVIASLLVGKIANQCGFAGASNTGEILINNISKDIYKGAACNSIIENIASASGCFVCCDSSNNLRFQRIGIGYSSASASDHSSIIAYPEIKYTRLIVSGNNSDLYDIGSGDANSIIELSNTLISESGASELASRLFASSGAFTYIPLNFNAVISGNVDPYGDVIIDDNIYTVTNILINLGADGAVAALSVPQTSGSSSIYNNLLTRQINQRVAANKIYGNTLISSSDGLELVYDNESYGFTTLAGGVTEYDGAMIDNVMPSQVETVADTSTEAEKRITYGGKTYSLKYKKSGNIKTDITLTEVVSS